MISPYDDVGCFNINVVNGSYLPPKPFSKEKTLVLSLMGLPIVAKQSIAHTLELFEIVIKCNRWVLSHVG